MLCTVFTLMFVVECVLVGELQIQFCDVVFLLSIVSFDATFLNIHCRLLTWITSCVITVITVITAVTAVGDMRGYATCETPCHPLIVFLFEIDVSGLNGIST